MNTSVRPQNQIHEMKCGELTRFDAETEVKKCDNVKKGEVEEEGEGQRAKVITDHGQPTQEEIDIHETTHCPF